MMSTLPPERELPPLRRAEIRSTLVRTVAPPARRSTRWLVPVTAAAAVAAIAGSTVAVSALGGADAARPPAVIGTKTYRAAPGVPGVSRERAHDIVKGCWRSYHDREASLDSYHPPRRPTASNRELQLYNLVTDAAGTQALLIGAEVTLTCTIAGTAAKPEYSVNGKGIQSRDWLADHLTVDSSSTLAGGLILGGGPKKLGYEEVSGRVSANVARVRVAFGQTVVTVTPVNGTFIARLTRPANWPFPNDATNHPPRAVAGPPRAYDAGGRQVNRPGSEPKCSLDPTGRGMVVLGPKDAGPVACKPAVRWAGSA